MSKRAEEAAMKACPVIIEEHTERDLNKPRRLFYINGYEQAEKETLERAIEWWRPRLCGFLNEGLTNGIIEEFEKAMEEDNE